MLADDPLEIDCFHMYFIEKIFYTNFNYIFWIQVKSKIKNLGQNKLPSVQLVQND